MERLYYQCETLTFDLLSTVLAVVRWRVALPADAQVLGSNAAEAEKLFAGEPETALIASILWAFEVRAL